MSLKLLEKQVLDLPKEIKFCKRCVVSNQRPRIEIDEEGICSACRFNERKNNEIDWEQREGALEKLLERHRRNDGEWDVIVPASGGKDSAFVAHQLKERWGMNPLTITWSPFVYTDIGYKNFRNFINTGFDNILATPNGELHRKLSKLSLFALGDAWQPFTYGQMCYAFHMALKFDIKLIFFGENGEAEYGGATWVEDEHGMPIHEWDLLYFKGANVNDLLKLGVEEGYFTEKDARQNFQFYRTPDSQALKDASVEFQWYSFYHKWVPQDNFYYAREHTGFEVNPERTEGTYSKYASIDDRMDGFHYYLAYIKFGIGRATSDAAHEVRDGHLTREEAVALVHKYDGEFPVKYYQEFLEYLDITDGDFMRVVDSWRQPHIWNQERSGWQLKKKVENL